MSPRYDGRKDDELREIEAKVGILSEADGSALFRIGKTVVLAAVYGPRILHPRHLALEDRALLRVHYNMATYSVPERKKPEPSRREVELSLVIKRALESIIFVEEFPKAVIDIYLHVLQADAGTRCAAITAASLALADAGVPIKDFIVGVAVGKVGERIVLDLNKWEEDYDSEKLKQDEKMKEFVEYYGEGKSTDMPLAYVPREDAFALIQMDGKVPIDEIDKMLKLGRKGALQIYKKIKEVVRKKYLSIPL